MAFSINNVRKILETQLKSITSLPRFVPENQINTTTIDPWCRATMLPSRSTPVAFGAGTVLRLQGMYQVDLLYPAGSSLDDISAVADRIMEVFFPGVEDLTDGDIVVTISNISQLPAQIGAKQMYMVPLQIDWFTFVMVE